MAAPITRRQLSAVALCLFAGVVSASTVSGVGTTITECTSRLPMSLSTVISDLEAEGMDDLATVCVITSSGVTPSRRQKLFGTDATSYGTDAGLCVAITSPTSLPEVAATAVACGGSIVFYADMDDLARSEGLFDGLAPAMERLMAEPAIDAPVLIVVAEDPELAREQLEAAAQDVVRNLVTAAASGASKASTLRDIFSSVQYVRTPADAMTAVLRQCQHVDATQAKSAVATTVASDFWQATSRSIVAPPISSATDLAAARQLGPAARKAAAAAIERVQEMAQDKLVPEFGKLCDAALRQAMDELDAASTPSLASSSLGKQIRSNLQEELKSEFADLCAQQLDLLQESCFAEFKMNLSKLRLGPNLESDMSNVVKESLASFAKLTKNMPISAAYAKKAFEVRLKTFCSDRLLVARSSGQFRPVPRKGFGIGLHWLLPKPFGNDYRQEPWMVHATDNLVYVPPDKITDMNPEDIAAGDWRSAIVPNPSGNDMIYMP